MFFIRSRETKLFLLTVLLVSICDIDRAKSLNSRLLSELHLFRKSAALSFPQSRKVKKIEIENFSGCATSKSLWSCVLSAVIIRSFYTQYRVSNNRVDSDVVSLATFSLQQHLRGTRDFRSLLVGLAEIWPNIRDAIWGNKRRGIFRVHKNRAPNTLRSRRAPKMGLQYRANVPR